MNVILDPLLFWLPDNPTANDIASALTFVDETLVVGRSGYQLVCSQRLWAKIVTVNYRKLSEFVRSHELHARLRELERRLRMVQWAVQDTETEGIRELINFAGYPDAVEWMTAVAQVVAHSINVDEDFCLMSRLLQGRNVTPRSSMQHCVIYEKTHWEVYISLTNANVKREHKVKCIGTLRNLLVPWTARHDDDLPDTAPNAGLAFVPKADWDNRAVDVIRTVNSKVCWIDESANAWSDTNTPGRAYHWDVFPSAKALIERLGNHVNITRYGTNDRDRVPGEIHH